MHLVSKVRDSGYSPSMIACIAEKILRGLSKRKDAAKNTDEDRKRVTVIPYMHKVSHDLKKMAEKRGTKVVFSAPLKMKGLSKKVNSNKEKPSSNSCGLRHSNAFRVCRQCGLQNFPRELKIIHRADRTMFKRQMRD